MTEPTQDAWEPVLTPTAKVVVLTISVATLLAGGFAVFRTDNEVGSAALVTAGLVMGVLAVFGDRIKAFEAGGLRMDLERRALRVRKEAEVARAAGDVDRAEQLEERADQLLVAAGVVGSKYDQLRRNEPSGWDRTSRMEGIVRDAHSLDTDSLTPADVARIFGTGSEGDRIVALALIEHDVRLATVDVLVEGIVRSQSAFEQFHALTAAGKAIDHLSAADRQAIRESVESALTGRLGLKPSNRRTLARHLLERLQ